MSHPFFVGLAIYSVHSSSFPLFPSNQNQVVTLWPAPIIDCFCLNFPSLLIAFLATNTSEDDNMVTNLTQVSTTASAVPDMSAVISSS